MSSSLTLHLKPENVDSNQKRSTFTVSVIGCDPIGVAHSCLFADAGFRVISADLDMMATSLLTKGKASFMSSETETRLRNYAKAGTLTTTNDVKAAVSQAHIIVIATPVKVDKKGKGDYSEIERTCKLVGSALRQNSIVVIVTTVGVGTVENTIKEVLENASGLKAGFDFALAYSPMPRSQKNDAETILNHERIVAAPDKTSLEVITTIIGCISSKELKKTNNVRAAELATLMEAVIEDAGTAVANELAHFCEKSRIDYHDAHRLLTTDSPNKSTYQIPSCEANVEKSSLLLENAETLNVNLRTIAAAKTTNQEMVKLAVTLLANALRNCGKTLRRARVALLGISRTPNVRGQHRESLEMLIRLLEGKGAKLSVYDPYFANIELIEMQKHIKKSFAEAVEDTDCLVIVARHDQFRRLNLKRLKQLMKMPAAIVDLEGILEPDKVEGEGFTYRGLGRGVWTR